MKVRIGYGLGTQGMQDEGERFGAFVDALERLRFDSLWLSERITGDAPDPIVGCAFAAGRTTKLKFGFSVLVLPGRNPVVLAKELATLDRLSGGRLLPAFGLGVADPAEQQGFGIDRKERAPWFDEVLPLLRRLWSEEAVDHDGDRFHYEGLRVRPFPVQSPLEVWLGGRAPSELRRIGRLGDGWLPSFTTPDEAAAGRVAVEQAADEAGRAIDPEHWGALVPYSSGPPPERLLDALRKRRPDVDPTDLIPVGLPAVRALLERFVERGFSKFVLVPAVEPSGRWEDELASVADEVLPLQRAS